MRETLYRTALIGALALGAANAWAAPQPKVLKQTLPHKGPIDPRGSLVIDNAIGSVMVIGTDESVLDIVATRVIRGVDDAAIEDGKRNTIFGLEGNPQAYLLRSRIGASRDNRWTSSVSFVVKIPRSVDVRISSHSGEGISVSNLSGSLIVKNVNGAIRLQSVISAVRIDSANGNITAIYPFRPTVDATFATINGDIDLIVPNEASFLWTAETLKGDFRSNLPLRGSVTRGSSGTMYRAPVNGQSVPNLRTVSWTGRVSLLTSERQKGRAKSLLAGSASPPPPSTLPSSDVAQMMSRVSSTLLLQPPTARTFVAQQEVINGNFRFETSMGNVFLGEIRGDANITTRAGEVVIGRVAGSCEVGSFGGPINLGDIGGDLQARTSAGDIYIRAARKGGVVNTERGNIQILFSGGPLDVRSGGGDISVRHSADRIRAQTKQGDIGISVDPNVKTERVEASTAGGNITLNVAPGFAGDFEITVITSDPKAERIHLDIKGLTVQRDEFSGRTRFRARGPVNGGGERVQLYVDEGDVHVRTAASPVVLMQQR